MLSLGYDGSMWISVLLILSIIHCKEIYMLIDELISSIKQKDNVAFKKLYEMYREQVYYTAYSIFTDKQAAEEVLIKTFLRVYTEIKTYSENIDFEDWLYGITADAIRKVPFKNPGSDNLNKSSELMGFVYEIPFKNRKEKPTEQEYDIVFEEMLGRMYEFSKSKLKKELLKKAASALIIVVIFSGLIYWRNYIHKISREPGLVLEGFFGSENFSEIPDYDKTDRYLARQRYSLYSDLTMVNTIASLVDVNTMKVKHAVLYKDEDIFLQVTTYIDGIGEVTGWIHEDATGTRLASTPKEGTLIKDEEIKVLVDEYLSSFQGSKVSKDKRISKYEIVNIRVSNAIVDLNLPIQDKPWSAQGTISIEFQCTIKPYRKSEFTLVKGGSAAEKGYIKDIYFNAEVEVRRDEYILTKVVQEEKQSFDEELDKLLKDNGFLIVREEGLLEQVPTKNIRRQAFIHNTSSITSDKEEILNLYLEYCKELSRAQGYDFLKYKDSAVDLRIYKVIKDLSYFDNYNLIAIYVGEKLSGLWLESIAYNLYEGRIPNSSRKKFLTVDGRSFDDIIKDKEGWGGKLSFSYPAYSIDRILELTSIYYGNSLATSLPLERGEADFPMEEAFHMAVDIEKDERLIKTEIVVEKEDNQHIEQIVEQSLEKYLLQFKDNRLSKYSRINEYMLHRVKEKDMLHLMQNIRFDVRITYPNRYNRFFGDDEWPYKELKFIIEDQGSFYKATFEADLFMPSAEMN
jgi:hypothetical protein